MGNIFGANWRTTFIGLALAALKAYQDGAFTDPLDYKKWLIPVALAAFGYLAKDRTVTGGGIQQDQNGAVAKPQEATPAPPNAALPDLKASTPQKLSSSVITRAPILLIFFILASCAGTMQAVRNNVESVDFKAGYGGTSLRTGVTLREPAASGYAKD